ncbi:MAG: metallophosphoesterase family protein [Caldilineaceae bacterium]|nr:metallophosphoesterase family protein [Caldilineaceae bacterium]
MRLAIFSDLHDNHHALAAVQRDAADWGAEQLIYLGDVGRDPQLFLALQEGQIPCLFGNWEVSGWQRLPTALAAWVGKWPATMHQGAAIFCHATPDMPPTVTDTAMASAYMAGGMGWPALFPRLHRQEAARWAALAALETLEAQVAFHGHTHVQEVWAWTVDQQGQRHLRQLPTPTTVTLEPGTAIAPNRYLVGVGSAGAPDDGPGICYARYDDITHQVTLRRL